MKIGERTLNNALFNALSSLLPLGLSLLFWPYIVGQLGESSYGIYALVGSVIGYFSLLDLGLGNAVVKYVSEYLGQRDKALVQEVVGIGLTLFLVAGGAGMLVMLSIAHVLANDLLKIPPDLAPQAFYCFSAAALGFFLTMLMTLFTSIINGLNRYDISSVAMAAMGAVTTLGSVAVLYMGFGLIAVVWLHVILPAGMIAFYLVAIKRLLPGIRLHCTFSLAPFKRVLHFGLYSMLSRVTDVVVRQIVPLLIGALLGMAAVTYYIIPFTILNRLTALLGRIGMVILPAISELQGQKRLDTIRRLYLTSYRIMISFAVAFVMPLLIFGQRFLSLWMGPEFAEQSGAVLVIITLGVFFDLCTHIPSHVVNGLGRPKVSGLAAISQATLLLILMVPAALYGGIKGVAAAYSLSLAIVFPFFVCYVNRAVVGLSLNQLWKEAYMRPLLSGLVVAVPLAAVPQLRIHNIFLLLLVMGSGVALYFSIALLFGVYRKHERQILREYLVKKTSRFRVGRVA